MHAPGLNIFGLGQCLIAVALSCLESAGVDRVAESQGGLGDRRHEEGLPQHMFELK